MKKKHKPKCVTHIGMAAFHRGSGFTPLCPELEEIRLRETPKMYISEDGKYRFRKTSLKFLIAKEWGNPKAAGEMYLDSETIRQLTREDQYRYYTATATYLEGEIDIFNQGILDCKDAIELYQKRRSKILRQYKQVIAVANAFSSDQDRQPQKWGALCATMIDMEKTNTFEELFLDCLKCGNTRNVFVYRVVKSNKYMVACCNCNTLTTAHENHARAMLEWAALNLPDESSVEEQ